MENFTFKGNKLFWNNFALANIAKKYKTHFYLYSQKQLQSNAIFFKRTFSKVNPLICFSLKSNSNKAIIKEYAKLGLGADVVSVGELMLALKSGIKPSKIVFSGVGKTYDELKYAISKKIFLINCESYSEVISIYKISKSLRVKTKIGLRINPNINAETHKKISTGGSQDKFGISTIELKKIIKDFKNSNSILISAISVHIGSQIQEVSPFKRCLLVLNKIIKNLKCENINIKYVDLGGGMSIPYSPRDKKFPLKSYAKLVLAFKKLNKVNIIFEPGRYLCGNIGVIISKIIYIKKGEKKKFIVTDVAMNDLIRTAMYDAHHFILPLTKRKVLSDKIEFVGPVCESSDKFGIYKNFSKIYENDYICITNSGAYARSLASNYNMRPLIAELMIKDNKILTIRSRQKINKIN